MTKAEAKRRCCRRAAGILDTDFDNLFLELADDGVELCEADRKRMNAAWQELIDELARRGYK